MLFYEAHMVICILDINNFTVTRHMLKNTIIIHCYLCTLHTLLQHLYIFQSCGHYQMFRAANARFIVKPRDCTFRNNY
jgi:hypothetical protein